MTSPAPSRFLAANVLAAIPDPTESSIRRAPLEPADRGAWLQSVLERFEGPLLRYALRLTRDLESARDVVQETLLRVCREDPAEVEGHLAAWLFRVCRSRVLDAHRKEQRMSIATDTDVKDLAGNPAPPDLLAARETNSRVLILMERLPDNQQEVIRLKFQNNLSYREIADVTGLSISNVGVQLHNGLKTLRRLLKDD